MNNLISLKLFSESGFMGCSKRALFLRAKHSEWGRFPQKNHG